VKRTASLLVPALALLIPLLGALPGSAAETFLRAPFVVTYCGQSPGAVMVSMACTQAKIASELDSGLVAGHLRGRGFRTLVIATGASAKGMGAAGTDLGREIARVRALAAEARRLGMAVVGAHVEGMEARTGQADRASIDAVLPLSNLILVVADSDRDGFFSRYARRRDLPIVRAKDALTIGEALRKITR